MMLMFRCCYCIICAAGFFAFALLAPVFCFVCRISYSSYSPFVSLFIVDEAVQIKEVQRYAKVTQIISVRSDCCYGKL